DDANVPDRAGYDLAVGCAAKLDAVAILYRTIAEQSGSPRTAQTAEARAAAADAYRRQAINLGAPLAQGLNDTERAIAEAAREIQQAQAGQSFEDFAVWVGREADRCPPPPATGG